MRISREKGSIKPYSFKAIAACVCVWITLVTLLALLLRVHTSILSCFLALAELHFTSHEIQI